MSDSFAIVRRGISIEYIRASRRDAALAALDSIEAENERLREIERAARRVMNDLQPHPEERLVLDGEVELRAALARIPESKP